MKKISVNLPMIMIVLLTMIFVGNAWGKDAKGKILLRVNSSVDAAGIAAGHPPAASVDAFMKYIKAHGNKVFNMKVFFSNQLAAKLDQTLPALKTGAFEIGNDGYGNCGGMTSAMMPLNLPFLLSTFNQAERFWDGPIGKRMRAKFEKDMGMKVIWNVYIGFRHITNSKRPIHVPADLKGLKIRTMNDPYQMETFAALGASPTPLAFSELFTAMQQGLVDGQENPISNVYIKKMYEVQKYLTKTGHTFTWGLYFTSQKWWNSLTPEAQAILMKAGEAAEKASLASLKTIEAWMEKAIIKKGMEVYTPNKKELKQFQKACNKVYKDIESKMGTKQFNKTLQAAENALNP